MVTYTMGFIQEAQRRALNLPTSEQDSPMELDTDFELRHKERMASDPDYAAEFPRATENLERTQASFFSDGVKAPKTEHVLEAMNIYRRRYGPHHISPEEMDYWTPNSRGEYIYQ